ncbi:MAG: alpha/beta hydrolase [Gammaproteobacteria bacterium]|nr:alpha/beta hydrolase [Gammaproteobacteria bacterium]
MASIQANGITLEYESLGDPAHPAVLLVMGLGMQMIAWPDPLCERLVRDGFRVVRFDNRDCGLSQKFDEHGKPKMGRAVLRALLGLPVRSPYGLEDMARDTVGLLDALQIPAAHVVGASMGGMIGQLVAALYPERVLSLTSIMSTPGARHLRQPSTRVRRELLRRPQDPSDKEAVIAHYEHLFAVIGSPGYPTPPDELRARMRRSVERGYHPVGVMRQLVAVLANGDRSELLARIQCPTLVIHGKADPLVPYEGGVDTAYKIRDARLALLDGFGHDFPPQLFERFAGMIADHARSASPPSAPPQDAATA